jgi:hypothetical protein
VAPQAGQVTSYCTGPSFSAASSSSGSSRGHLESHLAAGADGLTGVQVVLAHVDGLAAGRAGHLIIRLTGHIGVVVIVVCLGLVVGVVLFVLGIFVFVQVCFKLPSSALRS